MKAMTLIVILLAILRPGILLAPRIATAQPRATIPRVGVLVPGSPADAFQGCLTAFQQGLRDLGYVEGQTITFAYRYAEDQPGRLPTLAAELVQLTSDILWTYSTPAAQAAKQATGTIPIVVAIGSFEGAYGLVESLARPGGNLTGLDLQHNAVLEKRLELLKEAAPMMTRVAVLVNPANPIYQEVPHIIAATAQALGVHLQRVEARGPEALEEAFAAIVQGGADTLMLTEGPPFGGRTLQQIVEFASRHRLPTVSGGRHYAEAGGLLAYGAHAFDLCQRSAVLVDKILKGTKPADLPVERAYKFELIVNLKTAQALGLTLPPAFLFQGMAPK